MLMTFKHFDNIVGQFRATPVTGDTDWTEITLTKDAPPDTTTIEIGFMLLDGGTGWADNVHLRTLDAPAAKSPPPDPAT
jgi:hypothetical protein